jgi:hypothetical protein
LGDANVTEPFVADREVALPLGVSPVAGDDTIRASWRNTA